MGVETLLENSEVKPLQLVTVKLPSDLVDTMRGIRKTTGRTNTEVYSELLQEGVTRFHEAAGLTKSGKKRGRPSKNGKKKDKE